MIIGFTFSTLAIVTASLSLNFDAPSASVPVAPATSSISQGG